MPNRRPSQARPGFTLVEVLLVCVIAGLLVSMGMANFHNMQDSSDNASMAANVKQLTMALERYRSDTAQLPDGLMGTDNTPAGSLYLLDTTLSAKHNYLPGNILPAPPWTATHQSNTPAMPVAAPFVAAGAASTSATFSKDVQKARGAVVTAVGTMPPKGGKMAAYLPSDYGLIYYSVNANKDIYVVVGMGKRQRSQVIAEISTNGN